MGARDEKTAQDEDPFGDDYLDLRDLQMLVDDRRSVCRQISALGGGERSNAFQREIIAAIQSRRVDNSDVIQFDLVRGRGDVGTAIVRGELLVRAETQDDERLWAMLQEFSFEVQPVECLADRVLRLRNDALPPERLVDLARLVRAAGHESSVNHVAPLQPLVKGEGGPEPTAAQPVYPPAFMANSQPERVVRVAVVDTGITRVERDDGWLNGLATDDNVDVLDALPSADGYLDFGAGHGTFAAGIVQQVAPSAELAIYRAVDTDGIGSEVDVACAIVQAARDGAMVINLSLGAETIDDQPLLAIEVALEIVREIAPGTLVVAAAGNSGTRQPIFPAASRGVVAVGALRADLSPTHFSSHGFWVNCSAVGEGVVSTFVPGKESPQLDPHPDTWGKDPWAVWSGTSFAAPQISGAVARLCSENDGMTPRQALTKLFEGQRRVPDFGVAIRILPGT